MDGTSTSLPGSQGCSNPAANPWCPLESLWQGIDIVRAGISGPTLALRLQQLGVDVTLCSEGDAGSMRSGRLPNTVGRMGHAQARERELGSAHYRDPGCFMGSACAWIAAGAIAAGGPYDAVFCRAAADRMWEAAAPVTDWTNAFLGPPAALVMTLLRVAAARQGVADLVLSLFSDPAYGWAVMSSPEEVARIVDDKEEPLYDRV
jgi:hypothetical protein